MNRIRSHIFGTQPGAVELKKMAGLDAIDTSPLVSWLPDVPSQTYAGFQRYTKSCVVVMTMASPPPPPL
jgi:hypothetical protein